MHGNFRKSRVSRTCYRFQTLSKPRNDGTFEVCAYSVTLTQARLTRNNCSFGAIFQPRSRILGHEPENDATVNYVIDRHRFL